MCTPEIEQKIAYDAMIKNMPKRFRRACMAAYRTKKLFLTEQKIKDAALIRHIIPFVKAVGDIHSLDLSSNLIGDEGAKALAKISIHSLDVSFNHIGDAGAQALALNIHIHALCLGSNSIGNLGMEALAQSISIRFLDLYYNDFDHKLRDTVFSNALLTSNRTLSCLSDKDFRDFPPLVQKALLENAERTSCPACREITHDFRHYFHMHTDTPPVALRFSTDTSTSSTSSSSNVPSTSTTHTASVSSTAQVTSEESGAIVEPLKKIGL